MAVSCILGGAGLLIDLQLESSGNEYLFQKESWQLRYVVAVAAMTLLILFQQANLTPLSTFSFKGGRDNRMNRFTILLLATALVLLSATEGLPDGVLTALAKCNVANCRNAELAGHQRHRLDCDSPYRGSGKLTAARWSECSAVGGEAGRPKPFPCHILFWRRNTTIGFSV